ncbi:tripartite tricarboxylate transporter substrate binding protein [soil metagenome]
MIRRNIVRTLAAAAALGALGAVQAQGTAAPWPTKPIRLVIPFAAGGPADIVARFLVTKMSADLGQQLVMDNKGGAGGTLGAGDVAKSAPDGYTLLFSSTGALVIFPVLAQSMPYNPEKDLIPVGQAVITPSVIIVSSKSPFNSLADLVKFAKANPGKLNFASAGSGTTTQLGAELLKREAGIFITHIPYRGAAPAITDLIGGTADMMVADIPAALQFIKGGQLKALSVAAPTRSQVLPNIPTTAEGGYKEVISGTWYGFMAPAKTPPEIVARINASMNKALQQPDTIAFMSGQGVQTVGGSTADFDKFIKSEANKWQTLAKAVGAKLD